MPNVTNQTLKIKDFNLDSNKLSSLPAGIFDHVDIKRIHLSSNSLRNVDDDAFRGLDDSLEYLNLENNDLSNVPIAVSRLRKLSYLYLANNDIRNISSDAFQEFAENLRALSLATNNLDTVPVSALYRYVYILFCFCVVFIICEDFVSNVRVRLVKD